MPRSEAVCGEEPIFQRPSHPFRASDGADLQSGAAQPLTPGVTHALLLPRSQDDAALAVGALLVSLAAAENSVFQISIPASLRKPGGYSHPGVALGARPSYASTTQRLLRRRGQPMFQRRDEIL